MNQKLAKEIRHRNRKAGRAKALYLTMPAPLWLGPGHRKLLHGNVRLTSDCDRYHHQRMKRAIQRGAGRG